MKAIFQPPPKPIELEVLRPTVSSVLAGASYLLERLTKEKVNPLLNVSATGTPITYAPATQLGYWKSLVETIPTWQGYGELFEKLLSKKKGAHTAWDGTEAELDTASLSAAMKTIAASALTPRLSQQNLTGPVYYGAYTRAMLDNDLHFPLKEGEVLQVLWQGSVDLYYYEPNPTDPTSHDSVLTKLSLPNNADGTAAKDPYGTVKQLLLTKGTSSDIYAKIANNGLWVKGVRVGESTETWFELLIQKSSHQASSNTTPFLKVHEFPNQNSGMTGFGINVEILPVRIESSNANGVNSIIAFDTLAFVECEAAELFVSKHPFDLAKVNGYELKAGVSTKGVVSSVLPLRYNCVQDAPFVSQIVMEKLFGTENILNAVIEIAQIGGRQDDFVKFIQVRHPGITIDSSVLDANMDVVLTQSPLGEVLPTVNPSAATPSSGLEQGQCQDISRSKNSFRFLRLSAKANGADWSVPYYANAFGVLAQNAPLSRFVCGEASQGVKYP